MVLNLSHSSQLRSVWHKLIKKSNPLIHKLINQHLGLMDGNPKSDAVATKSNINTNTTFSQHPLNYPSPLVVTWQDCFPIKMIHLFQFKRHWKLHTISLVKSNAYEYNLKLKWINIFETKKAWQKKKVLLKHNKYFLPITAIKRKESQKI